MYVRVCLCVRTRASRGSLLDKVSKLTVTDEGAFGVLTVAVETNVWVQIALVHICACINGHKENMCDFVSEMLTKIES